MLTFLVFQSAGLQTVPPRALVFQSAGLGHNLHGKGG